MLRTQKKPIRSLACALGFCATAVTGLTASLWSDTAEACSVAGISYNYSESGRPIIWKNRDDNDSFFQNLRYLEAQNENIGGHICLEEYYWLTDLWVCGAGANESGFAVVNASVYEETLVHEILNVDVTLMRQALYECETVECFEHMLLSWNAGRPGSTDVVSSNFVAMDAHGTVMMWEANTEGNNGDSFGGVVNTVAHDPNENGGFVNHTNFNETFHPTNPGAIRRDRASSILQTLADEGMMNPLTVMQDVSKDVCHDKDGTEGYEDPNRFPTQDCISRYQTAAGVVIEGVAPGQDPRMTTLWANLGEPSVGLYLPSFPAAQSVPEELDVWMEGLGSSLINLETAFNKRLRLYDDWGAANGVMFNPLADTHMNKERLPAIQERAFPIEEKLYLRSRDLFAEFEENPDALTRERLEQFANEQTSWAFDEYADGAPSLIEILFLGYDITQNTINWMQTQVENQDELYDQTLEGAQLTWRYLGDQIPKELNSVYQVVMRMMLTQGMNPDAHITQTGSVHSEQQSSSSSSGSVWGGGGAISPALLGGLALIGLLGLRRRRQD